MIKMTESVDDQDDWICRWSRWLNL